MVQITVPQNSEDNLRDCTFTIIIDNYSICNSQDLLYL